MPAWTGSCAAASCTLAFMAAAAVTDGARAQSDGAPSARLDTFLAGLGFSHSEVARVHRSDIVAIDLPAGDRREVVVAGAARMRVPLEFFVDRVRDVEDFRRGPNVKAVRLLSQPPQAADFGTFLLDADDLSDLRRCRVGRCEVKFDERALGRFARDVDWSHADARSQANQIVRETLHGYASLYAEEGRTSLPVLRDQDDPISRADEAAGLVARTPIFDEHFAELGAYLQVFPSRDDPRAEDLFYWSQEVFGLKPVANLTHLTIWTEPGALVDVVIVSQQLYASHYFDGSLAVTLLFRDSARDEPAVYVVYINRTLGDGLESGWLAGIKRAIARSRARDGLSDTLKALRSRLEALTREAPRPPDGDES